MSSPCHHLRPYITLQIPKDCADALLEVAQEGLLDMGAREDASEADNYRLAKEGIGLLLVERQYSARRGRNGPNK
jgi:hypothetical protein